MNFPNNPVVGDIFEAEGLTFVWDGAVWALVSGAGIPKGGIIMWSGALDTLPRGWALCDGQNGTPDLRGRFVVGAGGTYPVGVTGGAESIALTEAQIPSHSHGVGTLAAAAAALVGSIRNISQTWAGSGVATGILTKGASSTGTGTPVQVDNGDSGSINLDASHGHTLSGDTGAKGGGAAHENRPPYFALAYIMKV